MQLRAECRVRQAHACSYTHSRQLRGRTCGAVHCDVPPIGVQHDLPTVPTPHGPADLILNRGTAALRVARCTLRAAAPEDLQEVVRVDAGLRVGVRGAEAVHVAGGGRGQGVRRAGGGGGVVVGRVSRGDGGGGEGFGV